MSDIAFSDRKTDKIDVDAHVNMCTGTLFNCYYNIFLLLLSLLLLFVSTKDPDDTAQLCSLILVLAKHKPKSILES